MSENDGKAQFYDDIKGKLQTTWGRRHGVSSKVFLIASITRISEQWRLYRVSQIDTHICFSDYFWLRQYALTDISDYFDIGYIMVRVFFIASIKCTMTFLVASIVHTRVMIFLIDQRIASIKRSMASVVMYTPSLYR